MVNETETETEIARKLETETGGLNIKAEAETETETELARETDPPPDFLEASGSLPSHLLARLWLGRTFSRSSLPTGAVRFRWVVDLLSQPRGVVCGRPVVLQGRGSPRVFASGFSKTWAEAWLEE